MKSALIDLTRNVPIEVKRHVNLSGKGFTDIILSYRTSILFNLEKELLCEKKTQTKFNLWPPFTKIVLNNFSTAPTPGSRRIYVDAILLWHRHEIDPRS
jgi:hypothetical protein